MVRPTQTFVLTLDDKRAELILAALDELPGKYGRETHNLIAEQMRRQTEAVLRAAQPVTELKIVEDKSA